MKTSPEDIVRILVWVEHFFSRAPDRWVKGKAWAVDEKGREVYPLAPAAEKFSLYGALRKAEDELFSHRFDCNVVRDLVHWIGATGDPEVPWGVVSINAGAESVENILTYVRGVKEYAKNLVIEEKPWGKSKWHLPLIS